VAKWPTDADEELLAGLDFSAGGDLLNVCGWRQRYEARGAKAVLYYEAYFG
jgi:hypothetical protein